MKNCIERGISEIDGECFQQIQYSIVDFELNIPSCAFINPTISLYYHLAKQTESAPESFNRISRSSRRPLINFRRVVYIRISHRPSSNNGNKMVLGFYSPRSVSRIPVRAASPSSIHVSSGAPFLFVVGEMIDRTENRSRRDS